MGIVIGIDVGGSTTKIVGVEDKKIKNPMFVKATDPVTSLFGAFGKYIYDNNISLSNIEKVILTGVGSAYIDQPLYGLPTAKTDEFLANGLGAQYNTGLDSLLVVSMGTGTSFVKVQGSTIEHIGGLGIGGGTILGLSKLLLKTHDFHQIASLAEHGSLNDIDLHIRDITPHPLPGLPLDVTKVRRVWPCQGGEGHFMARLVKAGTPRALPAPGEYSPEEQLWLEAAAQAGKKAGKGKGKPAKSFDKADARSARREASRSCHEAVQGRNTRTRDAGAGEATPAQSLAAWQEFAARYFPALAQRPAVVHGGGVLLPVPFPQTTLHVLRAGVFVGNVQKGRFVPEHHLFTAFGAQCANREELTLTDPRTVEYLSGREIEARTAADGWCCVTVDGWPLGGGKVSGGRVKNHYPKALRLL